MTGEIVRGFWWGNLQERVLLECQAIYGIKILKWIIKKWDWAWIGLV